MGVVEIESPLAAPASSGGQASSSTATTSTTIITSTNSRRSAPSLRTLLVILIVFVICVASIYRFSFEIETSTHQRGKIRAKLDTISNEFQSVPIKPQMEVFQSREIYFSKPDNHATPKGILIYLHSCQQSGLEFFHLPEDRIIAYDALGRGLAVVAPTSQHRESGCWGKADLSWIGSTIDQWVESQGLSEVPRIGMAQSSAGSFLFFVHEKLQLKSMAVYNTPQGFAADDIKKDLTIPTVFVTMPADESISKRMEQNYEALKEADVATQLVKVAPHPYTERVCKARIPEAKSGCKQFFKHARKDYSSLMDIDGFVKEDLKTGKWKELFEEMSLDDEAKAEASTYNTPRAHNGRTWLQAAFEQEITASQAYHSMTSESHAVMLDFLMKEARIGQKDRSSAESAGAAGGGAEDQQEQNDNE
jgi:hypothetical protein